MASLVNLKKLSRDLVRIEQKLTVTEDIATTRSLNVLTIQGRKDLVDEIVKEYDYPKNSIKRRIKPIKATRREKKAGYFIKSSRPGLAKPRKLKKGISHSSKGKVRVKITSPIKSKKTRKEGSRPFLVTATAGTYGTDAVIVSGAAKKVPVYRKAGFKRKTTTLLGSSVPKMVETIGINEKWLFRYIEKNFPREYRKQLKKAKYRGVRR